jgi:hypothetical protein
MHSLINPVVTKLLKFQDAFLTGSITWNAPEPKDVDIVIPEIFRGEVESLLTVEGVPLEKGEYYDSVVCKSEGYLNVQIIFLPMVEIQPWLWATEKMKALPFMPNKKARAGLFELFRAVHKLTNLG